MCPSSFGLGVLCRFRLCFAHFVRQTSSSRIIVRIDNITSTQLKSQLSAAVAPQRAHDAARGGDMWRHLMMLVRFVVSISYFVELHQPKCCVPEKTLQQHHEAMLFNLDEQNWDNFCLFPQLWYKTNQIMIDCEFRMINNCQREFQAGVSALHLPERSIQPLHCASNIRQLV